MAERDMERAEVAKATGHVGEMEQEITLLRDDREQVRLLSGSLVTTTLVFQKLLLYKTFDESFITWVSQFSKSTLELKMYFCR